MISMNLGGCPSGRLTSRISRWTTSHDVVSRLWQVDWNDMLKQLLGSLIVVKVTGNVDWI